MKKRVLNVGQCPPDQMMIGRFLHSINGALEIEHTDRTQDVMERLRGEEYALVLVNRKIDYDYSDGLDLIKALKKDIELGSLPVMLISNHSAAQSEAVSCGAEPGFGKNFQLSSDTMELLNRHLN